MLHFEFKNVKKCYGFWDEVYFYLIFIEITDGRDCEFFFVI